ncbi:hypothetical protein TNCV_75931 [Trichonephila clavipes]|nr:hypothetical protein TNCV_75931 [Trichonephila clavipes]
MTNRSIISKMLPRRNCCTQSPMCGGAPSCRRVIESRHWCCSIWGCNKIFKHVFAPPGRHGAGHRAIVSSLFEKKGPRMNVAVNPHQTVSFGE